jgi:D-alanyl-D-alanine carboxypeptidase/D-alanyl-D-alanine-endopeptidase (penicillin-binding protein 4)
VNAFVRAIAAACALSVVASCGGGHHTPQAAAARPAASIAAAAGAPAWRDDDLRALRARLSVALAPSALATSGIAIVDGDARPLFVRRERTPFAPASTFKLLVAASSITTLGPRFRYPTTLESVDDPSAGELRGDLYLAGSGDPTLTRDDLSTGIGDVVKRGVRDITGAVVADASAFSGPEVNPQWEPDDLQYDWAAGTSALSLDQGTVEFHLVPSSVGAPARIVMRPASDAVRILGGVLTSYSTSLTIDRAAARNDFTFGGHIAANAEQSFWRPVIGLPLYAAGVARAMLRAQGVTVDGGIATGIAPMAPAILWRHQSPPLAAIVHQMNIESNNHFAEQLLRTLGALRGRGTEAGGATVERAVLVREGAPQDGLHIVDGSGLAPTDRIAPLTLATLLARVASDPRGGTTFVDTLARVGVEGTVRYRRLGDGAGRVRAKSGHIENVNALAGYVQTRHHGRVAFTIIVNDRRADDGPVDEGISHALDILADS